jgi:hypothetical protein
MFIFYEVKMNEFDCKNECCFHWDEMFFCKCRRCDRNGSAAFVNQCRANKKFKAKEEDYVDKIMKIIETASKTVKVQ